MFNKPIDAILEQAHPLSIHGQRYYDLLFRIIGDDDGPVRKARAPYEETYSSPQKGDRVRIHSILGAVTKVEILEEEKS